MAEFKPMVKMETTEPSVVLKLKKGGHVNMKKGGKAEGDFKKMADGGSCSGKSGALQALMENPALIGRPAVNALVRSPGKPSMAARKAAMKAPVKGMKKGGKANGGMMGGLPTQGPLSSDKVAKMAPLMMPKSATPAPSATNNRTMAMPPAIARYIQKVQSPIGVKNLSGPTIDEMPVRPMAPPNVPAEMAKYYAKKGGRVEGGKTDMAQDKAMIKKAFKQHDAQEHMGGKGTKLALKNGGKMATGGVVPKCKSGGSVLAGPQKGGVRENDEVRYSPTTRTTTGKKDPGYESYQKGGQAKKAFAAGGRVESGAPAAMPQGRKKPQPPVQINKWAGTYKKGGCVKMKDGGDLPPPKDMSKGAYDKFYADEKAENEAMSEAILGFPSRLVDKMKELFSSSKPAGSVTKTEKSVTVAPGKKNGGRC